MRWEGTCSRLISRRHLSLEQLRVDRVGLQSPKKGGLKTLSCIGMKRRRLMDLYVILFACVQQKEDGDKSEWVQPHGWTEPRLKSRIQESASRLLYLRSCFKVQWWMKFKSYGWDCRSQWRYYVIGSGLLWHYSQLLADTFLAKITSTNIMLLAGLLHLQRSFIQMYIYIYIFNRDKFCPDSFWKVFGNQAVIKVYTL